MDGYSPTDIRSNDETLLPEGTDKTDAKGKVIFKLTAPKRPPSTPPKKYDNRWKDPEDPKDKWSGLLEAEFTLHSPKGISRIIYRWKVLTNKNVNLQDVLDGKAVWTYVDTGTDSKLVKEAHRGNEYTVEDPIVVTNWNSPYAVTEPNVSPEERSFNFAQFMLNEVVPRKRSIATATGAGAYVFLHESGLYGQETVKALTQFKEAFKLGRNTKADFVLNEDKSIHYNKDDNTSVSFRKMTKDYYKRSEERRVGKECRSRWSPYH